MTEKDKMIRKKSKKRREGERRKEKEEKEDLTAMLVSHRIILNSTILPFIEKYMLE